MLSSKNPFRAPPAPGPEEVVMAPPPSSPPPLPQRTASTSASAGPSSSSSPQPEMQPEDDLDELPPPYTPAPNAAMGEETVGMGPQRPFQPTPVPPAPHYPQMNTSPAPVHVTGPTWHPPPPRHPRVGLAPWQTQQQYGSRQNGGGGLFGTLVDTVRDIADVVSGVHDDRVMVAQRANAGAYATPYGSTVYSPPHGPPVQMPPPPPPQPPYPPQLSPPSQPPLRPVPTPPHSSPGTIPDDGAPTRTPVPGHPLLHDGNLLVYPRDHLCVKCKNTGYKNDDPSHPCRKCWEKYGRPYTGALTYTPWASSGNETRMQRPLPKLVPPHLASQGSLYPPQPHAPFTHSTGSGATYYVIDPLSPYPPTPPVPHAIPVGPGDPRLGGRLCWRCGGAGIRTVLLIDVTTCDTCGGSGRLWV